MAAPNDEAQTVRPAGLLGNVEADPATRDDAIVTQDAEACRAARIEKLRSTWPALAALAGFELRRLADGRWLASRWNLSRELDEAEVPGWLLQVGALS